MAKFAYFFTFKGETIKGLIGTPSDRGAVETHELLDSSQFVDILGTAGTLAYTPPGS